jgi:CBS domain-containing protein
MTNRQMAEIVRHEKPFTLPYSATVQEACCGMHENRFGAMLVTDSTGQLAGIFTGRDAVRMLALARDPTDTQLKDVMTKNPATLPPGRTAIDALRLMQDGGLRHVPVVAADGRLVGIVLHGDFRGLEHDRLDDETGCWERIA